MQLLV